MAEQPPHPKIVLQVNINCCLACPKKLEKALLKLKGVSSCAINKEENSVSVEGTVDPDKIIKLIYSKVSKRAKLISYTPPSTNKNGEKPKNTNPADDKKDPNKKSKPEKLKNTNPADDKKDPNKKSKPEKPQNTNPADDKKDPKKKIKPEDEGKNMHINFCCQDGNYPKMANNEHTCEEYDDSPQNLNFFGDYLFKQHHPMSPKIIDKGPEDERAYMQNYAPQGYYSGPSTQYQYPIGGSYYPPLYPERPPAQYGYYQHHPHYGYY